MLTCSVVGPNGKYTEFGSGSKIFAQFGSGSRVGMSILEKKIVKSSFGGKIPVNKDLF